MQALSREAAADLLAAAKAEQARRRLAAFVRHSWHVLEPSTPLEWNWHIELLCDQIQRVLDDWKRAQREPGFVLPVQNALFNVPPGTLKSRILAVCAPAWMWIDSPSWRVICLSINPKVSHRDARYSRELILSDWYQSSFGPTWRIKDDQDAVSDFGNTAGGSRQSYGMTAASVGLRGDAIFVDDPNNPKEVFSPTHLANVNDLWDTTIGNRVNDLRVSVRIGIMQRLHENDWSAHVLRQGWAHCCLPMEYDARTSRLLFDLADPRTTPGQVLHEARFTPAVLAGERVRLGSYGYAGQMQQIPAPAEGGMFKRAWWRFFKLDGIGPQRPRPAGCTDAPAITMPTRRGGAPDLDWLAISVDAAFGKSATSSRVGLLVIGGRKADRFVFHDTTRPLTFTETIAAIRALRVLYPAATKVLIEKKANGEAILDTLGPEMAGLVDINPEGGKESRANAISPQVESGNVYLLDGAPWLEEFVGELGVFPNGAHDDRVDALSQLLIYYGTSPAVALARAMLAP